MVWIVFGGLFLLQTLTSLNVPAYLIFSLITVATVYFSCKAKAPNDPTDVAKPANTLEDGGVDQVCGSSRPPKCSPSSPNVYHCANLQPPMARSRTR